MVLFVFFCCVVDRTICFPQQSASLDNNTGIVRVLSSCVDTAALHRGIESLSSWKASAAQVWSSVCVAHQCVITYLQILVVLFLM